MSGSKTEKTWKGYEEQDFLNYEGQDYFGFVNQIEKIKIREFYTEYNYSPTSMSDLFRWTILEKNGGWYFDMDQIFLRPFDELCNYHFIFGCEKYNYSGVIGAEKDHPYIKEMKKRTIDKLKEGFEKYCEAGNWLFSDFIQDKADIFKTPNNYFYPLTDSCHSDRLYSGEFKIPEESFALHWFGGHPFSQEFNKKFTEKYANNGTDTISMFLKKSGIL